MSDTIRAFVAIELPDHVAASIRQVQEGLKSHGFKMRWVRPERIHLTLKFLGEIDPADLQRAREAMGETAARFDPLPLGARGIGVFPGIKRPRVLWVGMSGRTDRLDKLQSELDKRLGAKGFLPEKRPFRGHMTLSRVKGRIDHEKLGRALQRFGAFESDPFVADSMVLFKSELKPAGPVYTRLFRAVFGPAGPAASDFEFREHHHTALKGRIP